MTTRDRRAPAAARDPRLAAFRPIRQRKVADDVVFVLADAIRSGLYRPGEYLPTIRELTEALRVSTVVIGEAVETLRAAGVVSVKRGHTGGILVESTANLPEVLRRLRGGAQATVLAILRVRRPLELTAAALAAEDATDEDLEVLRGLVDDLEEVMGDPERFVHTDALWHYALAERCGNPVLHAAAVPVLDQVAAATIEVLPGGRIAPDVALEHQRRTMAAIESRNRRRAIRAMDRHLAELEEALLGTTLPFP